MLYVMSSEPVSIRRLSRLDVPLARKLNSLFGDAFGEPETYSSEPPADTYLESLLTMEHIIVLVAIAADEVVGGLVAYELDKFERMRREIYIYDLAVAAGHRRRHIATDLIENLKEIAMQRGAWVLYVQANYGDEPAIALYGKLGIREEVLHFDIVPVYHGQRN